MIGFTQGCYKRNFFFFLGAFLMFLQFSVEAQTLPSSRSTDWTKAGIRVPPPVYTDTITFAGDNTGATDVSASLQTTLDNLTQPTVIQFPAGTYLFNSSINVPSEVVIKGLGADVTTFNFDLGGAASSCFNIVGSSTAGGGFRDISPVSFGDTLITVSDAAQTAAGEYIILRQIDDDLRTNGDVNGRTGQVSLVSSVNGNDIILASAVSLDYEAIDDPEYRRLNALTQHVGFECFTVNRSDQIAGTPINFSKFRFEYAANSWLKGIRSTNCNGSHVDARFSANLLVTSCYFEDAFNFEGGLAYGVRLLYATSECRIENSIFRRLRHSMVTYKGANGNVFAYNYSYDTYKTEFGGFFSTTNVEDIFVHGDYSYLNLFEGNVCNWIKIDNSLGKSGPFNTFLRNYVTNSSNDIDITNADSDNQNFLSNEARNIVVGSSTGHQIQFNSWQSSTGTLETSLAYAEKPPFLSATEFGAIGYPNFNVSTNPARDRVTNNNLFTNSCGLNVYNGSSWSFGTPNATDYVQIELVVDSGQSLILNSNVEAYSLTLRPGATVDFQTSPALSDSVYFEADTVLGYSQSLGNPGAPVVYEQIIKEPGWHIISSPVAGLTVADLGTDIILNYADKGSDCNLYTWQPGGTVAEYQAVVDGTQSLDQTALFFFVSDIFVKPGRGINGDGKLPIKLRFKGIANHGAVSGPTLGLGTSSHTTGSDAVGWNLIPNPYSSSLDLDVLFASLPANYQTGAQIWDPISETYELRSTTAQTVGNPTAIAPGQSFFVKLNAGANTAAGVYDFTEADRTITKSPVFKKRADYFAVVRLQSDRGQQKLYVHFNERGRLSKVSDDLSRFVNPAGKIAQWSALKNYQDTLQLMAVAHFPTPQAGLAIPLSIAPHRDSVFTFTLDTLQLPDTLQLKLEDRTTGLLYPMPPKEDLRLRLKADSSQYRRYNLRLTKAPQPGGNALDYVYLRDGELWAEFPAKVRGTTQLFVMDMQGRFIFETKPFLAQGFKRWKLPPCAPGIYVLMQKNAQGIKQQKIYLP